MKLMNVRLRVVSVPGTLVPGGMRRFRKAIHARVELVDGDVGAFGEGGVGRFGAIGEEGSIRAGKTGLLGGGETHFIRFFVGQGGEESEFWAVGNGVFVTFGTKFGVAST